MYHRPHVRRYLFSLLIFPFLFSVAHAQETTSEFWPEMDLWYRFAPSWKLSMYLPFSRNLETFYREGSIVLQADYAWGNSRFLPNRRLLDENRSRQMKACLTRGGFLRAKSLGDDGEAYSESMVFLEEHFRTPFKSHFLISHRLRSDFRWIGDDAEYSFRVRYRLMIEREWVMGKVSLVPYVNVEPYYDSRYETINRVRYIGGATVSFSPLFAIEGNITYQHDSRSSVTDLYALNMIVHVFFESGKARPQKTDKN